MDAADILAMPDPWEYPWFAAWDHAFHAAVLSYVDPTFAKYQLLALTREWYMHPNGALPAYEWTFDDVNPPVHAWAALLVYLIDGAEDRGFLVQIFHKLLLNFTWWVNRVDAEGSNLFEGGFLGLDNTGPFDRSHMPVDGLLEQSDGTGWMAAYCLAMLTIALELARDDRAYDGVVMKFVEHFASIVNAINREGLWDEDDGFFYDRLRAGDGRKHVLRYRSLAGVLPVLAAITIEPRHTRSDGGDLRFAAQEERRRGERAGLGTMVEYRRDEDGDRFLLSLASREQLVRVLADLLDEASFLSPYGLRSLSKRHREEPFEIHVDGISATVGYEPGESTSSMFGGNSNWRGPVWFPVNVLVLESFERFHNFLGDGFTVECPTGSGRRLTLHAVADELRRRLVSLFLPDGENRRPVHRADDRYRDDPNWTGLVTFHEYFDGDDGRGLGASHQTGWTGLVAHLIASRRVYPELMSFVNGKHGVDRRD
jgi:hypothetical protein